MGRKVIYEEATDGNRLWDVIGEDKDIKHILWCYGETLTDMYSVTDWALRNGRTVNSFYFARTLGDKIEENLSNSLEDPSDDSLFLFPQENSLECIKYNLHLYDDGRFIVASTKPLKGVQELSYDQLGMEWAFGNNAFISENGGQDTENGRILYSGGYSYGPYWSVPLGSYRVAVVGEDLSDSVRITVCSGGGATTYAYDVVESNANEIVLDVSFSADVDDMEILIVNNSDEKITLNSITLKIEDTE